VAKHPEPFSHWLDFVGRTYWVCTRNLNVMRVCEAEDRGWAPSGRSGGNVGWTRANMKLFVQMRNPLFP
jgi:hypothetical protein